MSRRIVKVVLLSVLFLGSISLAKAQHIAVNNGWNNLYVSSIGTDGSDYYAQAFQAPLMSITKFGVVIREGSAEGQISLAIAADNNGVPDYAAPLYEGALINPTTTGGWYYEEGLNIPVTPNQTYYVLLNGYNQPGATGWSYIGLSATSPFSGRGLQWSNSGGVGSWSTSASWPIAIYVEGVQMPNIPTLNEWGILLSMISLILVSFYFLKRFRTA